MSFFLQVYEFTAYYTITVNVIAILICCNTIGYVTCIIYYFNNHVLVI